MAGSASATKMLNEQILQAAKSARGNPYVRRLIEDRELRENALQALQSARKAYERASAKRWSKELADDRKLRRELKAAVASLREARDSLVKPRRRRRFRGLLLIAVAAVGGVLAANESARKAVLDKLFGREEEFDYQSTTASTNGSS